MNELLLIQLIEESYARILYYQMKKRSKILDALVSGLCEYRLLLWICVQSKVPGDLVDAARKVYALYVGKPVTLQEYLEE